ncbi:hypothetical protein [Spiroplasma turonicum]|uniref:Transmembrane protein n=1 Tax=Spiroplasma turonicum TaxID=216946 RepID=A0A0K1P6G4_9MOLU|nr:hypothetical protein [Spiroplasma turonicum]AKU79794.1 hypothetical protein STURON_00548 [Spiroplasma turonicum]ALX70812.1 hypothetical protein STURO_v1c05460 [Spiroplasma turonicum]
MKKNTFKGKLFIIILLSFSIIYYLNVFFSIKINIINFDSYINFFNNIVFIITITIFSAIILAYFAKMVKLINEYKVIYFKDFDFKYIISKNIKLFRHYLLLSSPVIILKLYLIFSNLNYNSNINKFIVISFLLTLFLLLNLSLLSLYISLKIICKEKNIKIIEEEYLDINSMFTFINEYVEIHNIYFYSEIVYKEVVLRYYIFQKEISMLVHQEQSDVKKDIKKGTCPPSECY